MARTVLIINPSDNVAVAARNIAAGEEIVADPVQLRARQAIPRGHKVAIRDIAAGSPVVKYGEAIGTARAPIAAGAWVHSHNMRP